MKKILSKILTMLQISVFTVVVILEYLSDKKMGVARYLTFKREEFTSSIFNPQLMSVYKYGLLVLMIINIFILFMRKKQIKKASLSARYFIIAVNLMAIIFIWFISATQFNAYHFFLIAFIILIILQFIKIIIEG